jgi:hypothetical protein
VFENEEDRVDYVIYTYMVGFELYGHLDDIYQVNIQLERIIEIFMVDT